LIDQRVDGFRARVIKAEIRHQSCWNLITRKPHDFTAPINMLGEHSRHVVVCKFLGVYRQAGGVTAKMPLRV